VVKHKSDPHGSWEEVYMDAAAWNKVQRNYHVNRLEAFALFFGLRVVTMFLEFVRESTLGKEVGITD
jgi:hypothetical protein